MRIKLKNNKFNFFLSKDVIENNWKFKKLAREKNIKK
jgi:hypothetical protein